jgi:predicted PurR-regulated permease PerM
VVLALALGGILIGVMLWGRLSSQFAELIETLPRSFQQIRDALNETPWGKYVVDRAPAAASQLVESGPFTKVTGLAAGVAGVLEVGLLILIVGIFGAAEPDLYRRGLLHLIPPTHRPRASQAIEAITGDLRHWLLAQILLMIIMGVTTSVALMLIGIPLALSLGLLTGILELIPYVGAWLSAGVAALVALLKGPQYVAYVLGLFLALHMLEGYVLIPLIQRKAIHLPPALALVTMVLMGELFGMLGLFVAAPLTLSVLVLVKLLYVEDTLGDKQIKAPGESG